MSFIKEITRLQLKNKLDHDLVEQAYHKSDVWQAVAMADYLLRDDDKLPMSLVDASNLIDNDFKEMVVRSKYYMSGALVNAKRLVNELEHEIQEASDVLEIYDMMEVQDAQ